MANLYEIEQEILNCVDEETGEVIDFDRLAELQMERTEKIEKVALWYRNLLSDAEQYKAEKERFAEKQSKAEAKAEQIKEWLGKVLNGEKFITNKVSVSYRKSEKVIIDNVFKIDERFLKYAEPTADKKAIKKAIDEGASIEGAHTEETISTIIK